MPWRQAHCQPSHSAVCQPSTNQAGHGPWKMQGTHHWQRHSRSLNGGRVVADKLLQPNNEAEVTKGIGLLNR